MQTTPRFSVVDNQQPRPIPQLQSITSSAHDNTNDVSDELLQIQIKLNADLMARIDALEAAKKEWSGEVKALKAAVDKGNKENAMVNAKLSEATANCNKLQEKLSKFKPVAKPVAKSVFKPVAVPVVNKENLNEVNQPNLTSN